MPSLPLFVLTTSGGAGRPPRAPAVSSRPGRLVDSQGRTIRDLRLSITDRCNFRCVYCLDPGARFKDREELLTAEEIVRLARVGAGLGVEKVRVTGGEPTVRADLTEIIRGIASIGALDVAMTTNGSRLGDDDLREWRRAGLHRITVSLDSLNTERFASITLSNTTPAEVVGGLRRAARWGFDPIKVNAVVVRGLNEMDVAPLASLARSLGAEVRFIEFMPLDSARRWSPDLVVPADEILSRIGDVFPLAPEPAEHPGATAETYRFADGAPGRIGVVAPVTRPFCGQCGRLRITADGMVRPCLFSKDEWDVRPVLRSGAGDDEVASFLVDATWTKQAGHGISSAGFSPPQRSMSAIGG